MVYLPPFDFRARSPHPSVPTRTWRPPLAHRLPIRRALCRPGHLPAQLLHTTWLSDTDAVQQCGLLRSTRSRLFGGIAPPTAASRAAFALASTAADSRCRSAVESYSRFLEALKEGEDSRCSSSITCLAAGEMGVKQGYRGSRLCELPVAVT